MVGSSILLTTCLIAQTSAPLVELSNPTVTPIADHPDIGTLDFDVTNRANQAMTAWSIRYTIQFSDGTSRDGGIGTDAILEYAGIWHPREPRTGRVVPARSTLRVRSLGPVDLTPRKGLTVDRVRSISLAYAVFADETSIGEQRFAGLAILDRGRRADAIASMLPILIEARQAGSTVEALRAALAQIKAKDRPDFLSGETYSTRQNLQLFLDGRLQFDPGDYLRDWTEELEARRAAYDAHRFPKSAPVSTLQVSSAGVGQYPDGRQFVDFDLTNVTDQAAVAWGIGFSLHLSDGSSEQKVYEREGLLVYEEILPPRHDPQSEAVVPPHKTIRTRIVYPAPKQGVTLLSATAVSVKYVAFADDTWSGSQAEVESAYSRRGMEAAAITRVLPVLHAALDAGTTTDALRGALAQLAGNDQPDFDSAARQVTRTNIQLLLEGKIPQPAVFLQSCIERLEASRAAYQSHGRPAQHGPGGR
jgi:hypothetical protein